MLMIKRDKTFMNIFDYVESVSTRISNCILGDMKTKRLVRAMIIKFVYDCVVICKEHEDAMVQLEKLYNKARKELS